LIPLVSVIWVLVAPAKEKPLKVRADISVGTKKVIVAMTILPRLNLFRIKSASWLYRNSAFANRKVSYDGSI
jgi:hypothetical protein